MTDRTERKTKKDRLALRSLGFISCLLVLAQASVAADGARCEKTYPSTLNPLITITNMMGQIMVRGWDRGQVRVVYTVVSPRVEVDTEVLSPASPADRIHLATHLLDPLLSGEDQTVNYSLDVPMRAILEIRNPQGSVRIEKLQGDDATVESVGGGISVSDCSGHLFLRTVAGDIDVVRASGRVEAYSITGSFHFASPTTSKLRGSTTSGRILFEGDFPDGGDYSLSTYSGDLEVLCPSSASFELNAKTVRGKLENEMPITIRHRAATPLSSANSLLGTHLTGKATVNLTSYSGTIRIRER